MYNQLRLQHGQCKILSLDRWSLTMPFVLKQLSCHRNCSILSPPSALYLSFL
ncbi:hypothetical protein HN51_069458, partial [Arachis hypogaea]